MIKLNKAILSLIFGLTVINGSIMANSENGPTPYPKTNKDWPGKGVIRKFGWMDDNRKWFWTQREKDQGAIVFTGDSLTAGWKSLKKDFPGRNDG